MNTCLSKIVGTQSLRRLLRPLLIASLGTALAGITAWSMAGVVAIGNSHATATSATLLPRPHIDRTAKTTRRAPVAYVSTDKFDRAKAPVQPVARLAVISATSARHAEGAAVVAVSTHAARFDAVVRKAAVSQATLASLFGPSSDTKLAQSNGPAPAQLAALPAHAPAPTVLAYADPSPGGTADSALSALLTGPRDDQAEMPDEDTASLPVFEDTPSVGPVPQLRPRDAQPSEQAEVPATSEERETSKPKTLAYARPDTPTEKKPKSRSLLGDLFGGKARAGNGVAVYDISAAKVYMPDGSVLEAHSGIGKMADNPRYTHVKMNGPTPAHTYNLKMRESRFHGVEAIRMLPVDGKNKFGRDGFLTHSYLLRGGREESHGCVAFADYNRFLNAFKQGKVKQLIVVPSGGRESFRVASNG